MSLLDMWSKHRSRAGLFGLFALIVACYGVFAWQGAIPLMSPDETASFAFARHLGQTGSPAIVEPRSVAFSWLHPRSFVAQQGNLLPVGFPLWMTILSVVGWIGSGEGILWLSVIVSASFVFPLVWLAERKARFSRIEALALALVVATIPTMILYGNRSLFTLVPQLSLTCWTLWIMSRATTSRWAIGSGLLAAITIGLRPVEAVWLLPVFVLVGWIWMWDQVERKGRIFAWLGGLLLGVGVVALIHAWVYGTPFSIGYLLRDLPAVSVQTVSASASSTSWWRAFFPYGFSFHQWQQNIRGTWTMGWWPWMVTWMIVVVTWVWKRRGAISRDEKIVLTGMLGLTVWLSFYYGQGRFADNIGGQLFHLGNSLFRYQTPIILAWTMWSLWAVRTYLPSPWNRRVFFVMAIGSMTLGSFWAFTDSQDGILINRQQRQQYAAIRAIVQEKSDPQTIWLSERSDKIVFPTRAATFIQEPAEVRRFLQTQKNSVWMFRRPPSQAERDRWYAEGLEFIAKYPFDRETIYEVRLRSGY